MSFSRANPLGWGLFEELTSSQMNTIDLNQSKAVDGTAYGAYAGDADWLGTFYPRGVVADFHSPISIGESGTDDAVAYADRYATSGVGATRKLVVVGLGGTEGIRVTSDFRNWSTPSFSGGLSTDKTSVATNGAGKWVAGAVGTNKVYYSTDNAVNWSVSSALPGLTGRIDDVVWNPTIGKFVAVGTDSGYIATSPDGSTWTQRTSAIAVVLGKIALGSGGRTFILTSGSNTQIQYSDDGTTWTAVTVNAVALTPKCAAYNARTGSILLAALDGSIHRSTNNGANWTKIVAGTSLTEIRKLVAFGGAFVGGAADGRLVWTIDDGFDWEQEVLSTQVFIYGLCVARNRLVFVCEDSIFLGRVVGSSEAMLN